MQTWPDWNKLYAKGQCLYYWVAFSDEQWEALNAAKSEAERDNLVRKYREEYMANRDVLTGELKKPVEEVKEEVKEEVVEEKVEEIEESIEDVKPVKKSKKGK